MQLYELHRPSRLADVIGQAPTVHAKIKAEVAPDEIADLRAEIEELKSTIMAMGVLRDVRSIATPAPSGHATTLSASKRDWSKVPTAKLAKLQELAAKTFAGSPKNKAVTAELTARGIQ